MSKRKRWFGLGALGSAECPAIKNEPGVREFEASGCVEYRDQKFCVGDRVTANGGKGTLLSTGYRKLPGESAIVYNRRFAGVCLDSEVADARVEGFTPKQSTYLPNQLQLLESSGGRRVVAPAPGASAPARIKPRTRVKLDVDALPAPKPRRVAAPKAPKEPKPPRASKPSKPKAPPKPRKRPAAKKTSTRSRAKPKTRKRRGC